MGILTGLAEDAIGVAVPPVGIAMKVLGLFKRAGGLLNKCAQAIWDAFKKSPLIMFALLASIGFGGVKWRGEAVQTRRADKAVVVAVAQAKRADVADAKVKAIKTAQVQAVAYATKAKDQTDARNHQLAATADRTATALRGQYHAAVMQLAAAQSRARAADLPIPTAGASSSNRPGAGAILLANTVSITTDDALICGNNTARLQAVRGWAIGLGAPVPAPVMPPNAP
jgi:hypothetical protein